MLYRLLPIVGIIAFGVGWELFGRFVMTDPLFFAPLSTVVASLRDLMLSPSFRADCLVSLQEFAIGYAISVVLGIALGSLFAALPWVSRLFSAIVIGAYATPLVAVIPLIIVAVGIGPASKIIIVILLAVFPIILNTESGFRSINPDYLDTAHAFDADRATILRKVVFPAAIVSVITGMRLAVGRAIIGVVVGEIFGALQGVGFLLAQYAQAFQTAKTLAIVLLLAVVGASSTALLEMAERRISPWRRGAL